MRYDTVMAARFAMVLASLSIAAPAVAQDQPLPRVIYGETLPQVLYGPESAPPPEPPRATPEPVPQPRLDSGTVLERGWVPVGPPVWAGPPAWHRPPPPGWRTPPPRIPDQPMPQGRMSGASPDARTPFERR